MQFGNCRLGLELKIYLNLPQHWNLKSINIKTQAHKNWLQKN